MTDKALETNNLGASNSNLVPLETESQDTLFVPFLGQSNGQHMSVVRPPYKPGQASNDTSGATVLEEELNELTDYNIVTSTSTDTNFAIGGSQVNGNGSYTQDDSLVWWYPEEDKPGGALLKGEQELKQWLSDNGAQPTDKIAIVWSQGEADAERIDPDNPQAIQQYKESTVEVFDYLRNTLGYENITFYIVPTGRFQAEGASNAGFPDERIAEVNENLAQVRGVQAEIATERNDVHLAPDYSDLNTIYQEGQIYGESYNVGYELWSKDMWHLGNDGLKVNGSRLAQYIAIDRRQNNVLSFTDSFGSPANSVSISRDGLLDIDPTHNPSREIIQGTDNPDVLVGSQDADEITGIKGDDIIIGTSGIDTLSGGEGNDVFFYNSATDLEVASNRDRILDFNSKGDRIDLSEPLRLLGYDGDDPIADGYVAVEPIGENGLEIKFDPDGKGDVSANTFAILRDTDRAEFQNNIGEQFIFAPTEF